MNNVNPIDETSFRHYLQFVGVGMDGLYEIEEPIGFDQCTINVDQDAQRYGRDCVYGASDKLTFVRFVGRDTGRPQIINPQGDVSSCLDHGIDWLLHGLKMYGFEFKVYYLLQQDNTFLPKQMLDFTDANLTDGVNEVNCKLLDKSDAQYIKRRADDVFNVFGTQGFKLQPLTPLSTVPFLLKPTPEWKRSVFITNIDGKIDSISHWQRSGTGALQSEGNFTNGVNNANEQAENGIGNTLAFYQPEYPLVQKTDINGNVVQVPSDANSFTLIAAKDDLQNVSVNVTSIIAEYYAFTHQGTDWHVSNGKAEFKLMALIGDINLTDHQFESYTLWEDSVTQDNNDTVPKEIDTTKTFSAPFLEQNPDFYISGLKIPRGKRLYLYWYGHVTGITFTTPTGSQIGSYPFSEYGTVFTLTQMTVSITAYQVGLANVIKGVRWVDFIKQSIKSSSDMPVKAPLFEYGGIHYNNLVFCRRMISGRHDIFNTTIKNCLDSLTEVNCDYEFGEDEIYIGHERDFYENTEIGVFPMLSSNGYTQGFNDRAMINKISYKYNKYEQESTVVGTVNAIHTESEWVIQNDSVENVKDIQNSFVRDPLSMQYAIVAEIQKPTTSVQEDDDVYIIDVVPMAQGQFGAFSAFLNMRISEGQLQILNKDSGGDESDIVINWTLLGFNVGDTFQITSGQNVGSYIVNGITPSVVSLSGGSPSFQGDTNLEVKYPYTKVFLQSRTNEGFADKNIFPNARYSIKRNMNNYFSEYMALATMYNKKDITNNFFKSNGAFTTTLVGESAPTTENATIVYNNLPQPIISGLVCNLSLYADYKAVTDFFAAYKQNRGFMRCFDSEGNVILVYPKKFKYSMIKNQLDIVGEEKYNPYNYTNIIDINVWADAVQVNGITYPFGKKTNWFKLTNGYFTILDQNSVPLFTPVLFNRVKLNGTIYTDVDTFTAEIAQWSY